MRPEQELQGLLKRIGLDRQEIENRCRFLGWNEQDAARLSRSAGLMEEPHAAFVEALYAHMVKFDPLQRILNDADTLRRLKRSQLNYYRRLWMGPYDRDYVRERLQIGLVHERVGVELKWYMGAYRMYLDGMTDALFADSPNAALYQSMLKAVFFDMTLAIDTYTAAQRQALEDSEARFARALRGANDGLWDWDVVNDRLYLSERWASMLGYGRDSFSESSQGWFSRVHPDDLPSLRQAIDAHLRDETAFLHMEYRIRRADGEFAWVLVRGVAERDRQGGLRMAGSQTDVSQRKAVDSQLRHAARHDPLTGLANRTRLDELLHQALQRQRKAGARQAALMFIDLDRFKLINNSLGHAAGDHVLIEVAHRLKRCLRPGDHLIRFGGDEFVVLLDDMALQADAEQVAQRMLESLQHPLHLREHALVVSASIGIAPLRDEGRTLDALQAADLALYRAKAAGKSQFARYSEELQVAAQHQLELESALSQSLAKGQFEVHYQPICRIDHGHPYLQTVEALVRWRHKGRLVGPLEFVPALEESGEIVRVGEWVLREACRQVRRWQLDGQAHLRCSVNLSSRQLGQMDFAARVADILRETGLPAASLILEITESLLMEDSAETLASLRELASLGIRLALDDFGTGYSSLGYLKRFPLHILKVDKSFISGTPHDPELTAISRAIIGLGASLGLQVVAEGVELQEHLDFLAREGCRYAQGYWFSRPQPPQELQRLFDSGDCFEGRWSLLPSPSQAAGTDAH